MSKEWTLAEGIEKLFPKNPGEESEIDDLSTYERQLALFDVSFAEIETDEIGGMKVEKTKGVSVMLTGGEDAWGDDDPWIFSRETFPAEGETLPELVLRIAKGLGIEPDERVWEDGDPHPVKKTTE